MSNARIGTEQLIPTAPASSFFAIEMARWKSRVYIDARRGLVRSSGIQDVGKLTEESVICAVGFIENLFFCLERV